MDPPVQNVVYDFGWEYEWHCHILSHEEMDMMRPIKFNVATVLPQPPVVTVERISGTNTAKVTWTDGTPFNQKATNPEPNYSWGALLNPAHEIGYRVERATLTNGIPGAYAVRSRPLANITEFTDTAVASTASYSYRVVAYNASGDSPSATVVLPRPGVPVFQLSPASLSFTGTPGATSAAQAVTIANIGTVPISITSIARLGTDAAQFGHSHTCNGGVLPASLPPGISCTVNVTFTPTGAGSKTASLSVSVTGATAQTVALTGTVAGATLRVLPAAVNFGNQALNTSRSQNLTVSNTGNSPLALSPSVLGGANPNQFSQFAGVANGGCVVNGAWRTLQPGLSCTIQVRFRPTSVGVKNATVTVNAAAPAVPVVVTLTGTGILP
jgi:hypothetical protein